MKYLQLKALKHASEQLRNFDTYPTYKKVSDALRETNLDSAVVNKILEKYQHSIAEQSKKIESAKSWVEALITDIEKPIQ